MLLYKLGVKKEKRCALRDLCNVRVNLFFWTVGSTYPMHAPHSSALVNQAWPHPLTHHRTYYAPKLTQSGSRCLRHHEKTERDPSTDASVALCPVHEQRQTGEGDATVQRMLYRRACVQSVSRRASHCWACSAQLGKGEGRKTPIHPDHRGWGHPGGAAARGEVGPGDYCAAGGTAHGLASCTDWIKERCRAHRIA
jgi:hypothetical protein